MRSTRTGRVAAFVVVTGTTVGMTVGMTGSVLPAAAGAPGRAGDVAARAVAACVGSDLTVTKGALEGAAGSRYLTVRVRNTGSADCSTAGWTRYRFRDAQGPNGYTSARTPGWGEPASPVVVRAGRTVRSVLSWVDPAPTVPAQCHARRSTAVRLKISDVATFFRLPLKARVCTTQKYRPHATRLGQG